MPFICLDVDIKFDFHQGCDLVLTMAVSDFNEGGGLVLLFLSPFV